jgi:hypothetical protein
VTVWRGSENAVRKRGGASLPSLCSGPFPWSWLEISTDRGESIRCRRAPGRLEGLSLRAKPSKARLLGNSDRRQAPLLLQFLLKILLAERLVVAQQIEQRIVEFFCRKIRGTRWIDAGRYHPGRDVQFR